MGLGSGDSAGELAKHTKRITRCFLGFSPINTVALCRRRSYSYPIYLDDLDDLERLRNNNSKMRLRTRARGNSNAKALKMLKIKGVAYVSAFVKAPRSEMPIAHKNSPGEGAEGWPARAG